LGCWHLHGQVQPGTSLVGAAFITTTACCVNFASTMLVRLSFEQEMLVGACDLGRYFACMQMPGVLQEMLGCWRMGVSIPIPTMKRYIGLNGKDATRESHHVTSMTLCRRKSRFQSCLLYIAGSILGRHSISPCSCEQILLKPKNTCSICSKYVCFVGRVRSTLIRLR